MVSMVFEFYTLGRIGLLLMLIMALKVYLCEGFESYLKMKEEAPKLFELFIWTLGSLLVNFINS